MPKLINKVNILLTQKDIAAYDLSAQLIAVLVGIAITFRNVYFSDVLASNMDVNLSNFLVTNTVSGVLRGLVTLYLGSGLLKICIQIFGGKTTWAESRVIFSWSSVPVLIASICALTLFILLERYGSIDPFITEPDLHENTVVKIAKYISISGIGLKGLVASVLVAKLNSFSPIRAAVCILLYMCIPIFILTPIVLVNLL